jgi:hypothetical protein
MLSDEIAAQVKHLQLRSEFAAEWQITAAGFWINVQFFLGSAAAALAAVSSGTAFSNKSVVAGSLAAAAALAAAVLASLRPAERADRHQQAAAAYHALAVDARLFSQFGPGDDEAQPIASLKRLKELEARALKLDADSPWAPRRLARKTQTFISDGRRYYDNEGAIGGPGPTQSWWSKLRAQAPRNRRRGRQAE